MKEKVYNIAKYSDLSRRSKVEDVWETAHAMNKLIHGLDDVMELKRPNHMGAGEILRRKKIKQESNNPNNFSSKATNRVGRILDRAIDRSQRAFDTMEDRLIDSVYISDNPNLVFCDTSNPIQARALNNRLFLARTI